MTPATEQYISTGEWTSSNANETFDLGRKIGAQLRAGDTPRLAGPLRAPNPIFVHRLAAGLDVEAHEETSPTIT
jgi:tRNA A37 threonylcarbamoyladenosine biosynthesis protein TsaE